MKATWGMVAAGSVLCGAGLMAYAVRGRSARWFGPSIYKGSGDQRAVALTFDDGPSESTPQLLEILDRYRVPATFFQCGANVRRLPGVACMAAEAGHEIGNHSDTHRALYLQPRTLIQAEFERAQRTMQDLLGITPRLMRAPFGARWFGFREMQQQLDLLGVMWTVIGRDWVLDGSAVARRVVGSTHNGGIICLHDGRELAPRPDVRSTLDAVRRIVPELADLGYQFRTISQLAGLDSQG